MFAPFAAAGWRVEAAAIPWIVASALLELVYYFLLTAAYSRSDLSLVYPIARGVAPVLVLVGATVAGVTLGPWQALGVVLVGGGVLLVRGLRGPVDGRGVALALVIAGTIAGYTLVDNEGIEHASAIAYLELVLLPVAVVAVLAHAATGRLAESACRDRVAGGRRRRHLVRSPTRSPSPRFLWRRQQQSPPFGRRGSWSPWRSAQSFSASPWGEPGSWGRRWSSRAWHS